MPLRFTIVAMLVVLISPVTVGIAADDGGASAEEGAFSERLREDVRMALRPGELARLGGFLVVSGALANTSADQDIRERWQDDFRGEAIDDVMKVFEEFGNLAHPIASIPLFWLGRRYALDNDMPELYTWSDRSARAMILAFPQHVVLRRVIGSPRPPDGPSDWDPFEDRRGVSGHAVYGAIPFMTAARMADSKGERALWWTLSTLPGLSRVQRDRHYLSQFVAGWGIAWQATRITRSVDEGLNAGNVGLAPLHDGAMIVGAWAF